MTNKNNPTIEGSRDYLNKRLNPFAACLESFALINQATKERKADVRSSDRMTSYLIRFGIAISFLLVAVSFFILGRLSIVSCILGDLVYFLAVMCYLINRFGVIRALSPNYALLCWQLMCGSSLLAIGITLNILFFVAITLAGPYICH